MTTPSNLGQSQDFSLVLGGPLFQLFRRAHLTGDALELSNRRVIIAAVITWVPLLLLSLVSGQALSIRWRFPFYATSKRMFDI